jgi:hypothetical protein
MARVDNPEFRSDGVACEDCPWGDVNGWSIKGGCSPSDCPRNIEEYAAACELAEKEAQR